MTAHTKPAQRGRSVATAGALPLVALGALVVLGAALRFWALGDQSFWLDEAFTKAIVDAPAADFVDHMENSENSPPLYYAVAWFWTKVFGDGEAGLRSLSAIAGIATIPVAYAIGRRVAGTRAGLLLAALVATSPFLVWYSQEARAYALVILLTSLSLLSALKYTDERSGRALAGWSITAALAVATHYFATFLVVAEAAWLLRDAATRRRVALACVPTVLVGLALVPLALTQRDNGGAQIGDSSVVTRLGRAAKEFLIGVYGGPVRGIGPLCALLVAAALAFLVVRSSPAERRRLAVPLGLGAAAVLLPVLVAVVGVDYITARHLAVAWIPLFAALAAGLAASRSGTAGATVALGLAALFLVVSVAVPLTPRLQRDDWRSAAAALGEPRTARAIVINPAVGFVPLRTYEPEIESPPGRVFDVREIDVIVMTRDGRPPPAKAPVPGFRLHATDRQPTYVVSRFVADEPRAVTIAELVRPPLTPDPSGAVFERPRQDSNLRPNG